MEQSQKLIAAQRKRILEQTMSFQNRLIESVLSGVLRKSNLTFDLSSPESAARDAGQSLVVVNQDAIDNVKELSQGASGMPFFTANVELERVLNANNEPMELSSLVSRLQQVVGNVRSGLLTQLHDQQQDGARTLLEYLSKPPSEVARPNRVANTARVSMIWPVQPHTRSPKIG